MEKKSWSEMTKCQRAGLITVGAVEVVLTTVAAVDLIKRPSQGIRGPKALWAVGLIVQPIGPIAYLSAGVRRSCGHCGD